MVLCGICAITIIVYSIIDKELDFYGVIALGTNLMTVALGIYLIITH